MEMGEVEGVCSSGQVEALGPEGGWQKSEQKEVRTWSRVGASGLGKKVGTYLEGQPVGGGGEGRPSEHIK